MSNEDNNDGSTSIANPPQSTMYINSNINELEDATPNNGNILKSQKGIPTCSILRRRLTHIPAKLPLLIKLPNSRLKLVELHPGKTISLGKFGNFKSDDIIGLPFGLTFEIVNPARFAEGVESGEAEQASTSTLNKKHRNNNSEPGELKIVLSGNLDELQDNDATNENINDQSDLKTQSMTFLNLKALKDFGVQGKDIVEHQVANNLNFNLKTSWSQQKFIMRKEAKHLKIFTPLPPTLSNVLKFHQERFEKEMNDKLRGIRIDSLSNILSFAGVSPGKRFLVIDGIGGLLTGSILERMSGEGRIILLNDSDSPPSLDLLIPMNLSKKIFIDPVLRSMNWACTEKNWQPSIEIDDFTENDKMPTGRPVKERDLQRLKKRKSIQNNLQNLRNEFFKGEFDGLIICSNYQPISIIKKLLPFLSGSSNIVIYSPFLQQLTETFIEMKTFHSLINISINEPFIRRFQVLPGRMHPEMMTSSTGGYILHAIRVLTDEETEKLKIGNEKVESIVLDDGDENEREIKKSKIE